ncbi:hypothetical protein [Mesotoga prima]|uniref:hypothetical protein n=1 Tax=Mesotoga prima TaxID=1184387 RepID=UPI002D160434|nr:hypothetical protein [Mesotoga prima]HPA00406.1 hypothetical protein [Mesotoga prima]
MKRLITLLAFVLFATAAVTGLEKSPDYYTSQKETKSIMEFTIRFDDEREIIKSHCPQIDSNEKLYEFIEERDIQRKILDWRDILHRL